MGTVQLDKEVWNERLNILGYPAEYNLLSSSLVEFGNQIVPSGLVGVAIKWGNVSPLPTTQTYVGVGVTLEAGAMTKNDLLAVVIHSGMAMSETSIEEMSDGAALMPSFQANIDILNAKFLQNSLISATKGAFAAASAANFKTTLAGETGTDQKLSFDSIMDKKMAMWPNIDVVGGSLIVHSEVYSDLVKQNAVLFVNEVKNGVYSTGQNPTIAGFRVVVNDELCVKTGTTNATFTSYITKANPFWINNTREPEILTDTNILLGGGTLTVAFYNHFCCAPAFASFEGTTGVTITDTILEVGTNWVFKTANDLDAKIGQIITRTDPTTG